MYRVFIAEDEPAALKHICTIIQIKCPGFEVVGTAENGKHALDQLAVLLPDILITDVKMPVLDGIGLVRKVKEKYPEILMVIISGYQEFDYARAALQSGVSDYILKPVKPATFQERMRVIQGRLDEGYYMLRNQMIRDMCTGVLPDEAKFSRVFSSEGYFLALFRKNGLPRRFVHAKGIEIFSIRDERMMVYGRDEMEALYICPKELLFHQSFYQLMLHMLEKEKVGASFYTLVLKEDPVEVNELPMMIRELYQELDHNLIIGKNQIVIEESGKKNSAEDQEASGGGELERLRLLLKERCHGEVSMEIIYCFERWEKQERTQLWVEDKVREMFHIFRRYGNLGETVELCEYFMDEAFYYASNMKELRGNILQILSKKMREEAKRIKIDTPEFFEKLVKYMEDHLEQPLSPQEVCRVFGISHTYLSRLFRKYSSMGFNKSLSMMRVNKAKEIMREKQNLFIKDIALMVGYEDQFYFSRIFRSVVGLSPTEYMESDDKA